jgi:phosphoribosyl-ATP pyrophosphohydrolase/phosphoribosyl-AMP cyclohydrolase
MPPSEGELPKKYKTFHPYRDRPLTLPYDYPVLEKVQFDERGLVPCVAQDFSSGEILMLAYANEEALKLTVETGEVHFFSRSRERIWRKGEESGNVLRLRELRLDCDGDAVVALVEPSGPACHTGERSCFFRELDGGAEPAPPAHEALAALQRTLHSRAAERPDGSYTVKLLDDPALIGAKVEEEAEEVVRAAREESDERVAEEAADLLYHLSVLLASREVPQSAVMEVLNGRRS